MTVRINGSTGYTNGDNVKLKLGASDDLQIYHTGSYSLIHDTGTGNLVIRGTSLQLTSAESEAYINCTANGGVFVYYDGAQKLATTNSGINVTGGVYNTTSGTNSQTLASLSSSSGQRILLATDAQDDGYIYVKDSSDATKVALRTDGNYSFINGGGRFGIGTDTPGEKLDVQDTVNVAIRAKTSNSDGIANLILTNDAEELRIRVNGGNSDALEFCDGTTARMVMTPAGNVGIGTTSPASPLHTKGTSGTGFYGNVVSTFEDSSNDYPALAFKGTSGHLFAMRCEGGESMTFATTPSGTSWNAVVRIDADGLKFNGDTSSANALDDYEEGTWTPSATLTYNPSGTKSVSTISSSGSYTKIGRTITIRGTLRYSLSGSGSYNLGCSGLPFSAYESHTGSGTARDGSSGYMYILESLSSSTINVFRRYDNGGAPNSSDTTLRFSATYQTT